MMRITKILTWLSGGGDPITATSRIAITAAGLVILSAGILGYKALYDLFVAIGLFNVFLAAFFPLLFDLAEVTAAVIVLNAKLNGEDDKLAWRAVLLFTGLGIVANIAHAVFAWYSSEINTGQAILGVFATALFPLSIALVTHLMKSVITRMLRRDSSIRTLKNLEDEVAQVRSSLSAMDTEMVQKMEAVQSKAAEIERMLAQIEQLEQSIEQLRLEQRQVSKGEFIAGKAEREAYQLDGLLAGGMTLTAACELVGLSPNTARKRLSNLNGSSLSKWRE